MRKFLTLALAALMLAFIAGNALCQSYSNKLAPSGFGGEKLKYAVKAHPVQVTLIEYDKTVVGGDTTATLLKANKRFSFVAPFTCLIDSFWVCYSGIVQADTIPTADTTNNLIIRVFTGGGAATAPATAAFVCSLATRGTTTAAQLAGKLRANTVRYGSKSAIQTYRYLTAGELYSVVIDTQAAGPSVIPRRLIAGWNLVPPDK